MQTSHNGFHLPALLSLQGCHNALQGMLGQAHESMAPGLRTSCGHPPDVLMRLLLRFIEVAEVMHHPHQLLVQCIKVMPVLQDFVGGCVMR